MPAHPRTCRYRSFEIDIAVFLQGAEICTSEGLGRDADFEAGLGEKRLPRQVPFTLILSPRVQSERIEEALEMVRVVPSEDCESSVITMPGTRENQGQ